MLGSVRVYSGNSLTRLHHLPGKCATGEGLRSGDMIIWQREVCVYSQVLSCRICEVICELLRGAPLVRESSNKLTKDRLGARRSIFELAVSSEYRFERLFERPYAISSESSEVLF